MDSGNHTIENMYESIDRDSETFDSNNAATCSPNHTDPNHPEPRLR